MMNSSKINGVDETLAVDPYEPSNISLNFENASKEGLANPSLKSNEGQVKKGA